MMYALLRKELRYLRPFIFIGIAFFLIDVIDLLWSPLGEQTFGARLDSMSTDLAITQIGLGFALGTGLLVREIDDGTLNFLDGLPLTRSAVFLSKVMAAMLVLGFRPLLLIAMHALVHLGMRDSLDDALHPGLLLTFFALSILVTAVGLGLGMLLGFLRYLSWLVLGLCALGIALLGDESPTLAAALNTADLLTLRFTGAAWQLPLASIWTQLGAVLVSSLLAFGLFQSAGAVLALVRKWRKTRYAVLAVLVVALATAFTMVMNAQSSKGKRATGDDSDAVEFTPIASGHATTRHYTFSYPALSGERLKPFIADADRVFEQVAALLGSDAGAPVDVDLGGTTDNHAGTAYHDRIRMQVSGASAKGVLAHETAHVFARRLAGSEYGRHLGNMTVFNEGLAEWVQGKVGGGGEDEGHAMAAAIVSKRRLVAPRQLTEFEEFASAVDENLKYSLGAIFIDQFVRRYGGAAPKTLLKTLAHEDFPRDLDGYVLWQTAFQMSGFDLDLVFDDYARHLATLEVRFARQIAALPRPRGSLVVKDEIYRVALKFDLPLPDGAIALVRFRPGTKSKSSLYRLSFSSDGEGGDSMSIVPQDMITRGEVCFQAGVMDSGTTIYEPWVCLPASSAGKL